MIKRLRATLVVVVCAAVFAGCGDSEPAATVYHVKGVIRKIKSPEVVVIDHEEIPGYMGAMAMPFKVKNAAEFEGLKAGDSVEFDYHVTELSSWIEGVKKLDP